MAQPSDADITSVVEFSAFQVSREEAAQLLKISNYDVGTAVNRLLDAPGSIADLLKQGDNSWDGAAWQSDRYGQYEGGSTNIPSFNIECVDVPNSGGPSAAPTRPPSRTSQRSAMSAGDQPMQSVETGQESGVVDSAGAPGVLRPATQDYYDNASWALVPATKSVEYVPDVPLNDQKRKDEPGFIKPTADDNRLSALITILHTIPLIRNTLLVPDVTASNYWRGEDWWKGTASSASITVDDRDGPEAGPEPELLYEVQRLMAFLDSSERTYASLDSLFQLDAWKEAEFDSQYDTTQLEDDDYVLKFLLGWSSVYKKHVPAAQLDGVVRSTVNARGEIQTSFLFDIPMSFLFDVHMKNPEVFYLDVPTLYDAIDAAMFAGESWRAYIIDPSAVLILRLIQEGTETAWKIPDVLYVDRYLEKNRRAVEANLAEREKYKQLLDKLDEEVDKLKYHTPQKVQYPKKMETLSLLKSSMKAFESDTEQKSQNPRDEAVLTQLQTIYQNVERKLTELEEEKKKAREALYRISNRFRAPMKPIEGSTEHKFTRPYKLRGAIKSKSNYYICHPDKDPNKPDTWWHIQYSYSRADDSASLVRNQTSLEEVLEDMSETKEDAVVVYANDIATSANPLPLSAKLDSFIKKDNANFQQEIAQAEYEWLNAADDWQNQGEGDQVIGDWTSGGNGWDDVCADDYNQQAKSTVSSDTLIPNKENDQYMSALQDEDAVVDIKLPPQPMEMQEVNGGISAWGGISNASSETVGAAPMDIVSSDVSQSRVKNRADDVQMADAEPPSYADSVKVEHIEVVEKDI